VAQFEEVFTMRLLILNVSAFLVVSVGFLARDPALANPDEEADLVSRLKKLEVRVAQLEDTIKKLQASAKEPPRTEAEAKLIGTWMVEDADKKSVSFPDIKFKGDGTCTVVYSPRPSERNAAQFETPLDAKYEVIGTYLTIEHRFKLGGGVSGKFRIASLTNEELVLSWELEGQVAKASYVRVK
jgi:hypothetical protein